MLVWISPKLPINIFRPHWENLSATIQNILTDFQLLPDSSSEIIANKSKCAIFVRTIIFNTRLQSCKIFPPYLFLWSICFQCDWIFFFSSSFRLSWFPCWQITHHSYENPHFDAWIPARRKIFLISRIFWSTNTYIFFRKDQGNEWFFNKTT